MLSFMASDKQRKFGLPKSPGRKKVGEAVLYVRVPEETVRGIDAVLEKAAVGARESNSRLPRQYRSRAAWIRAAIARVLRFERKEME